MDLFKGSSAGGGGGPGFSGGASMDSQYGGSLDTSQIGSGVDSSLGGGLDLGGGGGGDFLSIIGKFLGAINKGKQQVGDIAPASRNFGQDSSDLAQMAVQGVGGKAEPPPDSGFGQTMSGIGQTMEGFGKKVGDTLLGQSPRFDSIPGFVGDVLHGATDPHGLIGQAVRLYGAIAAFGHSPQAGIQYLTFLDEQDKKSRGETRESAARGWTPQQHEEYFGDRLPAGTQTAPGGEPREITPEDLSAEVMGPPDTRRQIVQATNTPEELKKAEDARNIYARSLPNYGENMTREQQMQNAMLAQRMKWPRDLAENALLRQTAEQTVPEGQFTKSYSVTPDSTGVQYQGIPAKDQSLPMEIADSWPSPTGYVKSTRPDPTRPGNVFMEFKNPAGENLLEGYREAVREPGGEADRAIARMEAGRREPPKLGSTEHTLTDYQKGIARDLTPGEQARYYTIQHTSYLNPAAKQRDLAMFEAEIGYAPLPENVAAGNAMTKEDERIRRDLEAQNQQAPPEETPEAQTTPGPQTTPGQPGPNARYTAPREEPTKAMSTPQAATGPMATPPPGKGRQYSGKRKPIKLPQILSDLSVYVVPVMAELATGGSTEEGIDKAAAKLAELVNAEEHDLSETEKEAFAMKVVQSLKLPPAQGDIMRQAIWEKAKERIN